MRRTSVMTMGFVFIFIGIQLNLVETYVLTPRFSSFLSEHTSPQQQGYVNGAVNPNLGLVNPAVAQNNGLQNSAQNSPFYQASYPGAQQVNSGINPLNSPVRQPVLSNFAAPKIVSPPSWLCWPVLFLGTVVFLHGFSMRRD